MVSVVPIIRQVLRGFSLACLKAAATPSSERRGSVGLGAGRDQQTKVPGAPQKARTRRRRDDLSYRGRTARRARPAVNQNMSFRANWIWRDVVAVAVICPAEALKLLAEQAKRSLPVVQLLPAKTIVLG